MNDHGFVTITEAEYELLKGQALLLDCLVSRGVTQWERYWSVAADYLERIGEINERN